MSTRVTCRLLLVGAGLLALGLFALLGEGLFRIDHVPPGLHRITTRIRPGVTRYGKVSVLDGGVTWIELRSE